MYRTLRTYLRLMLMVPFVRLFMFNEELEDDLGGFVEPDLDDLTRAYACALLRACATDWRAADSTTRTVHILHTFLSRLGIVRPKEVRRQLDLLHVSGGVYLGTGGILYVETEQPSPSGRGFLLEQKSLPALCRFLEDDELPDLMEGFEYLAS